MNTSKDFSRTILAYAIQVILFGMMVAGAMSCGSSSRRMPSQVPFNGGPTQQDLGGGGPPPQPQPFPYNYYNNGSYNPYASAASWYSAGYSTAPYGDTEFGQNAYGTPISVTTYAGP